MNGWFHCNKCLIMGNNNVKFSFSSCGHIICADCLKTSGCAIGQRGICVVCQKQNSQFVEISRAMSADLLPLFRPPKDVFEELMKKAKAVSEFQASHAQRLIKHHVEKSKKTAKYARAAQMEMAKRIQSEQALQAEKDKTKQELEKTNQYARKLERVLAEREKELQKCQQHTPPNPYAYGRQHRRGGSNGVYASLNGDTPLKQLSFGDCVTSTPFLDQFAKPQDAPYPGKPDYDWFNTPDARREDHLAAGGRGFSVDPSTPMLLMGSQKDVTLKGSYF